VFERWCEERGLAALQATPEGVCGFLADEATRGQGASTLGRRLGPSATSTEPPGSNPRRAAEKVKAVLSGIRRTIGAAAVRKKAATSDIVLGTVGGRGTSLWE
jgi:hypothetical protein